MGRIREILKYLTRGISSIAEGSASLLDIGATHYRQQIHSRQDLISIREDALAFYDDWRAVGHDLEKAMRDFERETGIKSCD